MRGRDEHHKARYEDFGCDSDGVEYVKFSKEQGTKTGTGVEREASRQIWLKCMLITNWIDAQTHYSRVL